VTDFDGRLSCAFCVRAQVAARRQPEGPRRFRAAIKAIGASVFALVVSWAFFYLAGQLLVRMAGAASQ
jgi:hypothetical protein